MSVKLMSMVFDADIPDLGTDKGKKVTASTAAFVLLALADHANDEGDNVYPSITLLQNKTKLYNMV